MALQPVGSGSSIASGASASHAKFSHKTDVVRVYADGCTATVAVGNTAVAAATDFIVPANHEPESINIGRPSAQRVVGVTTTNTNTVIDFPEGTGCPFEAGDAVSLTVTNGGGGDQSYYDFSHKCVASVNNSAGVNGYFGTRCIINNNYGVGYAHTALSSSNYAELRGSFKVACLTSTGSGNAYIQQVQVSGDT